MGKVFEEVNLTLERTKHALLALLVGRRSGGQLDLLDRHQQAIDGIHAEVDFPKRASADQCSFYPLGAYFGRLTCVSDKPARRFGSPPLDVIVRPVSSSSSVSYSSS